MRVLQVSESDNIGGAAIAATRLNSLLIDNGVESSLVVQRKKSIFSDILGPVNLFDKLYAKIVPHLIIRYNKWKFGTSSLSSTQNKSSVFFSKVIKREDFEILHLHWVNNGFVGLDDLSLIKKPIVWSLHDNWLFTAGCHSTQGCMKFLNCCDSCPKISGLNFQSNLDNQFKEKLNQLQKLKNKIKIVVPSQWMYESVKSSKILSDYEVELIPNSINVDLFIPKDKIESKQQLSLDPQKKYILFGASDPLNDENKGFKFIQQMDRLDAFKGYTLIIFGKKNNIESISLNIPIIFMDSIYDTDKLVSLYNVAEVLLMPSIHESFGQVAAEAMSCGVPVLCFNTTGLIDIVDHKFNGYLAELYNIKDLIRGFNWIIMQGNFGAKTRLKIMNEFSKEVVFEKMFLLYKSLLKKGIQL